MAEKVVPLVKAAQIVGKSYHAMLNCVLRGDCRGEQDDRGRWQVNLADAQHLAKRLRSQTRRKRV